MSIMRIVYNILIQCGNVAGYCMLTVLAHILPLCSEKRRLPDLNNVQGAVNVFMYVKTFMNLVLVHTCYVNKWRVCVVCV
jgi:hypothetical protein